ncbi:MAG: ParA family protein [Vicinamibacteria bacterium]|nr:ParA family protein [Vicinamibacteria bacterium]
MRTVAFFNNKGGVGKTSLVYHLAWMYAELGVSVLAADLDPQANLTAMFLPDDRIEGLWPASGRERTVYGAVRPLLEGTGDVAELEPEMIDTRLRLLPGDLALARSEDELSSQWPDCLDGKARAFRVITAFWRLMESAAVKAGADLVLIDVGPNVGAINRAVLIAAEHVVIPLAPDLYSIQGLQNLGPTLRGWRQQWSARRGHNPVREISLPPGSMTPAGYVVMQHAVRLSRPVKAYDRWMTRIPSVYSESVLDQPPSRPVPVASDPNCLAALKHYRSLMPLAQEARKPMFFLRPADGAIGGHAQAVAQCYQDFKDLARTIGERCGIPLP